METEFIYWRHHTLPGIKVEEICGGENRPMSLWREMAYQVLSLIYAFACSVDLFCHCVCPIT